VRAVGLKNLRAICPNCQGKIPTQPKNLLGSLAIAANGPLMVKTGVECPYCHVALTGKVTLDNHAVLAPMRSTVAAKAQPTGQTERCHVMGGGRQCWYAQGHDGAHEFKKKRPRGAPNW
jgi:hypothetical protein